MHFIEKVLYRPVVPLLLLTITACKPESVFTTSQDTLLKIKSTSAAHYKDKANCTCLNSTEDLYTVEGTKAVGIARCGYDAQWVGCENLRCGLGKDLSCLSVDISRADE